MASQFIILSFLLLPIMASLPLAGPHSFSMYSTPTRHRLVSMEEAHASERQFPLARDPSRTSSPGTYVPNIDSMTVLGKRWASPTEEPSPSPTDSRSRSPELYLPNTQPAPHAISDLGAGSSCSVDPTTVTPAHSLPTPEDLFHSPREPSMPALFIVPHHF
ncbi:hypothetical protein C8R44DRAFT_732769 [Mycena epipterygia]|nr:hypothetical protein C8R44DRAFT_732769 [Mycena epipterygia]